MATPPPETIPAEVLDLPAEGVNLAPGTVRDQIGSAPTLLVFLRHTGCIFCREAVEEARLAVAADPAYPPVLFVYQGTADDGRAFFEHADPAARALADAPRRLYAAFGLGRARLGQVLNPEVIACGFRAMRKGHRQGKATGDPWQMPGMFLVEGDRVAWSYRPRHVGDHPDFATIPRKAAESIQAVARDR